MRRKANVANTLAIPDPRSLITSCLGVSLSVQPLYTVLKLSVSALQIIVICIVAEVFLSLRNLVWLCSGLTDQRLDESSPRMPSYISIIDTALVTKYSSKKCICISNQGIQIYTTGSELTSLWLHGSHYYKQAGLYGFYIISAIDSLCLRPWLQNLISTWAVDECNQNVDLMLLSECGRMTFLLASLLCSRLEYFLLNRPPNTELCHGETIFPARHIPQNSLDKTPSLRHHCMAVVP